MKVLFITGLDGLTMRLAFRPALRAHCRSPLPGLGLRRCPTVQELLQEGSDEALKTGVHDRAHNPSEIERHLQR